MKNMLKKYWILLLVFFLLTSIFLVNTYKYLDNFQILKKGDLEVREKCNSVTMTEDMKKSCEEVKKMPVYKIDFYSMLFSTFSQGYHFIIFIIFLLIVVFPIKSVCHFLKNNMLKNVLTRQGYKKTILRLFANAYKASLILPILAIISFIVCYIATGNFDYNNAIQGSTVSWSLDSMKNPALFMFIYAFRIFIVSLIYINISLIVCKKNHSFIVATILSYLYFLAIEIFLEVVCNMLIFNVILHSDFGIVLNILSIFSLYDYYGLGYSIIVPLIFLLVSSFLLYFQYKDKESLIIECEKNN